jgi:hypothetical protein
LTFQSSSSSSKLRTLQVVPPTPTTTESSHMSMLPNQQSLPLSSHTDLPPTPTQPPPLPPSSSLRAQLPSNVPTPNRSQSPLTLPENVMPLRGPKHVQHVLPRAISPLNASRQVPMTVEVNSGLFRGLASPSSIESLYVDAAFSQPAPHHQQSLSDLRPLMTPRVNSPPTVLPQDSRLSSAEELAHSRSSSRLRQSTSLHHSRPVLVPLRRGADDSNSIITSESSYAPDDSYERTHFRNVSSETVTPGRGDPVMLFPGSVRAAGYAPHSSQTTAPPGYHDGHI